MFDFDGNAGGGARVSLAGKSKGRPVESRDDFIKRQQKEREARERRRIRDKAATKIQAVFRRYACTKAARAVERATFDKRHSDIVKVSGVLPVEQKAKFVFRALLLLLRQFSFFFVPSQDSARLASLLDLVLFSARQPQADNIFHLALAEDGAVRRSFLALLEKLLSALLRVGRLPDAASVLLALKAAFSSVLDPQRLKTAVAQLLRRTQAMAVLSRELLPTAARPSTSPQDTSQTLELLLLLGSGIEVVGQAPFSQAPELLVQLLSTPRLGEFLCQAHPQSAATLQLLAHLVLATAQDAGRVPQAVAAEEIEGAPRAAWLLGNFVYLLEKYLLPQGGEGLDDRIQCWLVWTAWAKESCARLAPRSPQLELLHRPVLVRALLSGLDRRRPDGIQAVCGLFFSTAGDSEAPTEVLQALAFATPLAEYLFPTLADLLRAGRPEAVFDALGPPALATPQAVRLRVFCTVYALQMQPMYDDEFFGSANPLRRAEVESLARFLNGLSYHLVTTWPDQSSLLPSAKALRNSITSVLSLLYHRHCRKPILEDSAWIIPESRLLLRRAPVVDLGGDTPTAADEDAMEVDEDEREEQVRHGASSSRQLRRPATQAAGAEKALEAVLEEIPHVLPFEDRVLLLHNVIMADQEMRRDTRGPWAQAAMTRHQIRRNFLVEDGYKAFEGLGSEDQLRDIFRVEFIAPDGTPESGVDGGGLFKEFMIHICRTMFSPEFGLFCATSDQTLYPSPAAFKVHDRSTVDLYVFLGKVVGKAIYEMFLLEPQFSRVFLNRLLGRTNEVDDVAALDKELHRNMLQIKEQDVDSLGLTFSVSVNEMGHQEEVDLIPNGRNVPVTKEGLTRYFHLMANFKTNVQFKEQTAAFLRGLQCVIPLSWLKMFDPYELNNLISGNVAGFDVADLRANTVYSGGYEESSPTVQWLWQLLQGHLEPEDMGRFLMFATSCSRAPLLGFKNLHPKFCIHRVPDSVRLPTASTCANLLKLPDYTSFEVLKDKVIQAIRAEAGFDLS